MGDIVLLTSGKAQGRSHLITSQRWGQDTHFLFKVILAFSVAVKCLKPRCFNSPERSIDASWRKGWRGRQKVPPTCCVSFGTLLDLPELYKCTPCPGDFQSSINPSDLRICWVNFLLIVIQLQVLHNKIQRLCEEQPVHIKMKITPRKELELGEVTCVIETNRKKNPPLLI